MTTGGGGGGGSGGGTGERNLQELQEQVAYLKAFGQACRVQLRAYLEALLADVETEWGRAHPAVLPPALSAARDQQVEGGQDMSFHSNEATAAPAEQTGATASVPAPGPPA